MFQTPTRVSRLNSLAGLIPSLAFLLLFSLSESSARTISWGGAVMDSNIQSDGENISASFTFQLGYFQTESGTFEGPNEGNVALWSHYWQPIDQSLFREDVSFFSSMATILEDGRSDSEWAGDHIFPAGQQAYIWAYNTTEIVLDTEWALITNGLSDEDMEDDWLIPESSSTSLPLEWRVSGATEAVVGALGSLRNGEGDADVVKGAGETSTESDEFSLQTYRIMPLVIPEPSVSLMILMGIGASLLRRQRSV